MTRAGLQNSAGGTCHLLLGKVVFSSVFSLGCQLPQHSLMLAVGSLSLLGTLNFNLAKPMFCKFLYLQILSSSLRLCISLSLLPCKNMKNDNTQWSGEVCNIY